MKLIPSFETSIYENSIGKIFFDKIILSGSSDFFDLKKIAYIEVIKRKHILLRNKYYLKIILTSATSKFYFFKKNDINHAVDFALEFSKYRSLNTDLD
jgi:hypothetical protein